MVLMHIKKVFLPKNSLRIISILRISFFRKMYSFYLVKEFLQLPEESFTFSK